MEINNYLKIQDEEFLEFGKDIKKVILVAAKDSESLTEFYQEKKEKVNEYIDSNSYVVSRCDGYYELFILGSYSQYRKRFISFLNDYYQIPKDYKLPSSLNVDHVFNKERAKDFYIRMILLDEKANKAWGRAYEKTSSMLDKKNQYKTSKNYILLDYSVLLKILGFPSFKKSDIVEDKDISKIADKYFSELEILFGPEIMSEPIKIFYRAEINRLVTGQWRDPEEESTSNLTNNSSFEDKLMDIVNIATSFSKEKPFKINDNSAFDGNYFYKSNSDKGACLEILRNLAKVNDIDFQVLTKGNSLTSMIVRLYFYDNTCQRHDILIKRV